MSGIERIAAERRRQIEELGFIPEVDDLYPAGHLARAGACYAAAAFQPDKAFRVPADWPWTAQWWKPGNALRDLEKAGALIAAEIERLERLEMPE